MPVGGSTMADYGVPPDPPYVIQNDCEALSGRFCHCHSQFHSPGNRGLAFGLLTVLASAARSSSSWSS